MKRIKLGILQTNHDKSVEVGDAYPDDAHRFRDLFDAQEARFEYKVYMTIGGEVPKSLDEQDAFLITGSPLSVLDTHIFTKDLVAFVRACDNEKKTFNWRLFWSSSYSCCFRWNRKEIYKWI